MNLTYRLAASGLFALALTGCTSTSNAQVAQLDPNNPSDAMTIARKQQCSTIDNEPIVYGWSGKAYSRRQGEKDVNIFDVEGMNIRACAAIENDKGTPGFQLVSREILLYLDPATGEVLKTWDNPWTGETVDVLHVANDPVNFKMFETGRDGQPSKWTGEISGASWWYRSTFPLWYSNPLAGDYQTEIGGTYHASELFNFFGETADLLNPKTTTARVTVGWSRIADWLPWMKMNGREGVMYMHTAGKKLGTFDELSDRMKTEIATHYPEWNSPPPEGDPRPNMTSWMYYEGITDGTIARPER